MKNATKILWVTLVGAVIFPALAYLVPAPNAVTPFIPPDQFNMALAFSLFMAWLYISSAILFLAGLDVFKDQLRHAYQRICLGLCFLGALLIQIPVLVATNISDSLWATSGAYLLPYAAAWIFIYTGVRSFAKTLGDTGMWVNIYAVLGITVAASAVAWVLVHLVLEANVNGFLLAINIANILLVFVCAVLILRIKNRAGPAYTNALAWFSLPLIITLMGNLITTISELAAVDVTLIAAPPYLLTALLFVRAGYAFNKIKEY